MESFSKKTTNKYKAYSLYKQLMLIIILILYIIVGNFLLDNQSILINKVKSPT